MRKKRKAGGSGSIHQINTNCSKHHPTPNGGSVQIRTVRCTRWVALDAQRAGAENLMEKEANNDAGLAAHPSGRWMMNCNWFQIAMLAYNLNCWLQLFNREEGAEIGSMRHTTLATARLRFLFAAA